jgi:hypothetical protein
MKHSDFSESDIVVQKIIYKMKLEFEKFLYNISSTTTLTGKKSGTLIKQQIYSHNTYFDVFWTGCDDNKHNLEH